MKYSIAWTKGALDSERKQLIVAVDHGMSFPDMQGLHAPVSVLEQVARMPEVDGIIATAGVYRQAANAGVDLSSMNRLLTVDCVMLSGEKLTQRQMVYSAEDIAMLRPDCLKMFLNMYGDRQEMMRNLQDVAQAASAAHRVGVSCLAEIMFWNHEEGGSRDEALYNGCRMAMEAGADALKIPPQTPDDVIRDLMESLRLPVFTLGGNKSGDEATFLHNIFRLHDLPICGLMFGRNVWQSNNMACAVRELAGIIKR
ncbi:MAG: hypothetical protein PHY12_07605 [Eubacteriales bacterium]|nr:hypothetical protein [Eubacteriales bacterium]